MCRLMAYIGEPSLLADIVLWPNRSIIKQSYDAHERLQDPTLPFHLGHGNLNGDGFGIGWFCPDERRARDPTPCTFTSVTPAWNNDNLVRLACKVVSPLIFAHVRAAYPGIPVSEQNCHPFQSGRYLWMHNGVVGGFHKIRRSLLTELSDAAYDSVQSFHSDSAVSFALFLNHLPDIETQQPAEVLLQAMQDTLATIAKLQQKHNVTETSLLNFVVSDGVTIVATRYVIPSHETPPSLYYAEGSRFVRDQEPEGGPSSPSTGAWRSPREGRERSATPAHTTPLTTPHRMNTMNALHEASYHLEYGERGAHAAFVASEPITGNKTDWVAVPKNSAVVIIHEKGSFLCSMRAALDSQASSTEQQAEVKRCLEAVSRGMHDKLWQLKRRTLSESALLTGGLHSMDSGTLMLSERSLVMDQVLHLLTGHVQPVLTTVLDDHGNLLFSASAGGIVKEWDINALKCIHTFSGPRRPITQLHLSASHLYAVAGSSLWVWDRTTRKCVYLLRTDPSWGIMRSIAVSKGIAFMGSQDSTVKAFNLDPSKFSDRFEHATDLTQPITQPDFCTDSNPGHVGAVNAVVLMGNKYVASAGADAMVRVWRQSDLQPVKVLRGHRGGVLCLLALGNLLLSGGRDNQIRVWDTEHDMLCRRTLQGHRDDVTALSAIRVRQPRLSWGPLGVPRPGTPMESASPARFVHNLAFTLVASSSADGTVRIWSTNWTCIRILDTPSSVPPSLSGDGSVHEQEQLEALSCAISERHVLVGYGDSNIRLWCCDDLYMAAQSQSLDELIRASNGSSDVSSSDAEEEEEEEHTHHTPGEETHNSSSSDLFSQDVPIPPHDNDSDDYLFVPHTTMDDVSEKDVAVRPHTPDTNPDSHRSNGSSAPHSASKPPLPLENGFSRSRLHGPSHLSISHVASAAIDVGASQTSRPGLNDRQVEDVPLKAPWSCNKEHRMQRGFRRTGARFRNRSRKEMLAMQQGGLVSPTVRRSVDYQLEECLREFVRIPTVSSEPRHREDCFRGAKYLCRLLESLGAEIKMAKALEDKNPVVIARLGQNPDKPTITFYGHYDVQPAQEPDWLTNPFELHAVDGYLYGRGTSDNKGPVLSFIFAVKELLEKRDLSFDQDKQLDINIVFVFEGEEENGSQGFRQALQQNAHWFKNTQMIVISNTQWVGENKPCLTYGMRGMISLSVQVVGPEKDVHSGNDGGVFREPMSDLCKILGSMVDPSNNQILVPGLYSGVKPGLLDQAWTSLEESDEFTVQAYQNSLGVPALSVSANKREVLEGRWCRPSLSVVDIRATVMNADQTNYCYRFGPTRFSVIPKSAVGKVSLRYVAEQDAQELVQRIRSHVESEFAKLGSPNKVSVVVESIGDWWEADAGSELFKMAEKAIKREWGVSPLYVREGGTMPVASVLQKALSSPVLVLPMGQSSDNCHLANERIRRINLLRGKNVICHLLEEFEQRSVEQALQKQQQEQSQPQPPNP